MSNDAKEVADILDVVSEKIPRLVSGLVETFYSAKAGEDMGKAVGGFYKELINAGIPTDEALKMSKDYMLSLRSVIDLVNNDGGN